MTLPAPVRDAARAVLAVLVARDVADDAGRTGRNRTARRQTWTSEPAPAEGMRVAVSTMVA